MMCISLQLFITQTSSKRQLHFVHFVTNWRLLHSASSIAYAQLLEVAEKRECRTEEKHIPGTPNNQKEMVVPIWQLKSFT